ncbi:40S ribosomal protein S15-like [Microtus oregoni]|uniref:40S ribosomal protein S15-like n=1 Tax=Microtus oregoni TaxID=111838 RepID=UPI001BB119B6|nr:40S ribosomal protein S15-like [Microtus oregoni]
MDGLLGGDGTVGGGAYLEESNRCRPQRWSLNHGLWWKRYSLLKRPRKAKKEAPPMGKPVKTHLGDTILLPEMVGSMVGVYNVKTFNQVEIKPQTIGRYLGVFSSTYKPLKHSQCGMGATYSSSFIPLQQLWPINGAHSEKT